MAGSAGSSKNSWSLGGPFLCPVFLTLASFNIEEWLYVRPRGEKNRKCVRIGKMRILSKVDFALRVHLYAMHSLHFKAMKTWTAWKYRIASVRGTLDTTVCKEKESCLSYGRQTSRQVLTMALNILAFNVEHFTFNISLSIIFLSSTNLWQE